MIYDVARGTFPDGTNPTILRSFAAINFKGHRDDMTALDLPDELKDRGYWADGDHFIRDADGSLIDNKGFRVDDYKELPDGKLKDSSGNKIVEEVGDRLAASRKEVLDIEETLHYYTKMMEEEDGAGFVGKKNTEIKLRELEKALDKFKGGDGNTLYILKDGEIEDLTEKGRESLDELGYWLNDDIPNKSKEDFIARKERALATRPQKTKSKPKPEDLPEEVKEALDGVNYFLDDTIKNKSMEDFQKRRNIPNLFNKPRREYGTIADIEEIGS